MNVTANNSRVPPFPPVISIKFPVSDVNVTVNESMGFFKYVKN